MPNKPLKHKKRPGRPPRPKQAAKPAPAVEMKEGAKARPGQDRPVFQSFATIIKPLLAKIEPPDSGQEILHSSPLAHLEYEAELGVKNDCLAQFWNRHRLPGKPEPVIPSPRARHYRTTSKRRALLHGPLLYLLFGDKAALPKKKDCFQPSGLEPAEHEAIYRFLQQKLSEANYRLVAAHLNYLIIRGSYTEQVVIFNVDMMNGPLVRKLKNLSAHLQKLPRPVTAAFVYLDPSSSDYYLESRQPTETLNFKKLFGPDQLTVTHTGLRYRFHPTSFSQINESMVPIMLEKARELLAPQKDQALLDFYCGYGLFSHFLAPDYRQVTGIEAEGPSVKSAKENGRISRSRGGQTKFIARRITAGLFEKFLPEPTSREAVLLDPPRQGPLAGVISSIARRRPETVLHIFCGVDQIPASIKEWQGSGYHVRRVVPLDMFPGSANLEVLILLGPKV